MIRLQYLIGYAFVIAIICGVIRAAFPAMTSVTLVCVQELTESVAASGESSIESLASYDPASSSWKTSQLLLEGGLTEFSGTWPRSGIDAEWEVISAAEVGAPHLRERVWIVAYPVSQGLSLPQFEAILGAGWREEGRAASECGEALANPQGERRGEARKFRRYESQEWSACCRKAVAHPYSHHVYRRSSVVQVGRIRCADEVEDHGLASRTQWSVEPNVGRVAHGVPNRVDRLRALGNAVVPQIPEMFAREIKKALDAQKVTA